MASRSGPRLHGPVRRSPPVGAWRDLRRCGRSYRHGDLAALAWYGFETAICFEPDPGNAAELRHNLATNGLAGRTRVVEAAVSDGPERLSFERADKNRAMVECGSVLLKQDISPRKAARSSTFPRPLSTAASPRAC